MRLAVRAVSNAIIAGIYLIVCLLGQTQQSRNNNSNTMCALGVCAFVHLHRTPSLDDRPSGIMFTVAGSLPLLYQNSIFEWNFHIKYFFHSFRFFFYYNSITIGSARRAYIAMAMALHSGCNYLWYTCFILCYCLVLRCFVLLIQTIIYMNATTLNMIYKIVAMSCEQKREWKPFNVNKMKLMIIFYTSRGSQRRKHFPFVTLWHDNNSTKRFECMC